MDSHELINQIVSALVIPILPAVTGYVVVWLKTKTQVLNEQIKNQTVKNYVGLLDGIVTDVVISLNQVMADDLKKSADDGKLTKEEADRLKEKALNQVKLILGRKGNNILKEVYGDVNELISIRIESTIKTLKSK